MRGMVENGEVDHLVAERVWIELEGALATKVPARFLKCCACGALKRLFPEIEALYGVPQPEKHHPEIDTGVHTMMVLDAAARLTPDTRVRFAAFMHDLGKGATPPSEWPQHIGHEQRGAEMIRELARRFRVPNDYRDLAVLVARLHGNGHRAEELRSGTLLETLEALDVFPPPRAGDAVHACLRGGFSRPHRPRRTPLSAGGHLAPSVRRRAFGGRGRARQRRQRAGDRRAHPPEPHRRHQTGVIIGRLIYWRSRRNPMSPTLNRIVLLAAVVLFTSGCAMLDGGVMHAAETKPAPAPAAKAEALAPQLAKVVWHVDFADPRRLSAMIQNVNNMVSTYQGTFQEYDVRIVFIAGGHPFRHRGQARAHTVRRGQGIPQAAPAVDSAPEPVARTAQRQAGIL